MGRRKGNRGNQIADISQGVLREDNAGFTFARFVEKSGGRNFRGTRSHSRDFSQSES